MGESRTFTVRDLARAIPYKTNLDNVGSMEPAKLCEHCQKLVPDRSKKGGSVIPTDFEREDRYPDFPELKASGKAGCVFCHLLRKTIRSSFGSQPIQLSDSYDLVEGEADWEGTLNSKWDGLVKIHDARFEFTEFGTVRFGSMLSHIADAEGSDKQEGGHVTGLSIRIEPPNEPENEEGTVGGLGKVLHFKVYDSIGTISPFHQKLFSHSLEFQRRSRAAKARHEASAATSNVLGAKKCRNDEGLD